MKCIDENGDVTWSEGFFNVLKESYAKLDPITDSNGGGFLVPECLAKALLIKIEKRNNHYRSLADRCMSAAMRTTGEMKSIWIGHEQALRMKAGNAF